MGSRAIAFTEEKAARIHQPKRVRASDHALRIALKAIQDAGLPVDKVCVTGGQIEIHCRPIEGDDQPKNHKGPQDW